jgi:hypothetical protein
LEAFEITNEAFRNSPKYEEKKRKYEARVKEKEEKGAYDIPESL